MVAKVILQRIWRSGIVSVAILVGLGSVGSGNVNARSHQPETKVMALVPLATSHQIVKRSYPEGNRTFTAASEARSGNVYSQFRRGPSNPSAQPPANQPAPSGNQKVFQAKIKRRAGGTPVIDVVFNGNKTFEMIVDTGASGTLITQRMATALGVRQVGTGRAGIADGSIVEFPIGVVRSIRVGGAAIQNVEVAIAKQMEIGLLGHDFFGNYDVKIKKDVVEFYVR
ncbi:MULTISPECIES: TIGR02281 family clan AA aspartic protease [unclassified Microcoleus]|uniref:retropepsin-like aspartic protease family protein n=1 Tax=unclassified Microcoleus TaxID=2642155 RepID=UPI0025E953F4|nr:MULTISPECIES: retropepsin-like aspartic protease [unclassified Microcoleus]